MLIKEECVPCHGGIERLNREQANLLLAEINGWEIKAIPMQLVKSYAFKNFAKALAFVNAVSEIAEQQGHHPDISFGWGYATLSIHTHAILGLHRNDFILAAKNDEITQSH